MLSDVHLGEIASFDEFERILPSNNDERIDVIILAGDIGKPFDHLFKLFIQHCSNLAQVVLFVPGNHEYYNKVSMNDTRIQMNQTCQTCNNVFLLDNKALDYGDFTFIGSTLWADIDEHVDSEAFVKIADFSEIPDFTPTKSRILHQECVKFIKSTLDARPNRKVVVITHHAPVTSRDVINPRLYGDTLSTCFYNDLDKVVARPNIRSWFYGHTHHSTDIVRHFTTHTVRIASNQYQSPGYKANKIFKMI